MFNSRAEGHPDSIGLFRCPDAELCMIGPDPCSEPVTRRFVYVPEEFPFPPDIPGRNLHNPAL